MTCHDVLTHFLASLLRGPVLSALPLHQPILCCSSNSPDTSPIQSSTAFSKVLFGLPLFPSPRVHHLWISLFCVQSMVGRKLARRVYSSICWLITARLICEVTETDGRYFSINLNYPILEEIMSQNIVKLQDKQVLPPAPHRPVDMNEHIRFVKEKFPKTCSFASEHGWRYG